jgi:hypothetical protein
MSIAPGVGEGPAPIRDDALLRRRPHAPALRVPYGVLVDRRPDESTAADFLANPRRRFPVGENQTTNETASSTICATTAADARALAQIRYARGQQSADARDWARTPMWVISVIPETCRAFDPYAGLRLADLRQDEGAPTLQDLDEQARLPGSPAWTAIGQRRPRDCFLGEFVRNEIDDSATLLFDLPALARLYEAGCVSITPAEDIFSAKQLQKQPPRRERARRALKGWATELDTTTRFLLSLGGLGAAVVGLLKLLGLA